MPENTNFNVHTVADVGTPDLTTQQWGGLASFLLAVAFIVAPSIYLFGNLRDRMGARRMSLALLAAGLAAGAMLLVACIQAANRHYHLIHPELHLDTSSTVLIVWTTVVAGVTGAEWHLLGWTLLLVGSAGWTSGLLPRLLSMLYLVAGTISMFVYLLPEREGMLQRWA